MRIENLEINNFRGISKVSMSNLSGVVVIAGQNGSGKSCIFDAIRLVKSVYGGYQANEWHQWMGEFQIDLTKPTSDLRSIFNDVDAELRIQCDFALSSAERRYICSNAEELIRERVWKTILPEAYMWGSNAGKFAAQVRERESEVAQRVEIEKKQLLTELDQNVLSAVFKITRDSPASIQDSIALAVVFSTFRPKSIGVIDYHGAQRHYGRENVQGINLNLDANNQQRSQTALYNYAAKYNNVKSEMAASYIKEILAEQAGLGRNEQASLTNTLHELFATFFPDKKFLGPKPTIDGALQFPVETLQGRTHDLDELSAGEKEILYGYLRIRNSAPRDSIILLDEPELHLNPRLIRGLPEFYKRNLGEALGNQIWLVTHSDALLREVVGSEAYNVFHMLPCGSLRADENQLKLLDTSSDLDLVLADLVGDLASYRPNAKVIVVEGGGDSEFDRHVISSLFPELAEKANLISGSNKARVGALFDILQKIHSHGVLPFEVYSITDLDNEESRQKIPANQAFTWNVYHIENYFLVPLYIHQVALDLNPSFGVTEAQILSDLQAIARELLPQILARRLSSHANSILVRKLDTAIDPASGDHATEVAKAVQRSASRVSESVVSELSKESLSAFAETLRESLTRSLEDGSWIREFPGRDLLKRLVGRLQPGVSYQIFRNLVLAKMKDGGYRPEGMALVIGKILA